MLAADGARAWPAALPDVPQLKGRLTGQLETLVVTSRQKVYQYVKRKNRPAPRSLNIHWKVTGPNPTLDSRASGVKHGAKVYTPTSKLKKKDLPSGVARMLKRNSTGKQRLAKQMAAGDNSCEGLLGNVKASMRRLQSVGRGGSEAVKTVQALSAAALHRHPGLAAVLDAHTLASARVGRRQVCLAPRLKKRASSAFFT